MKNRFKLYRRGKIFYCEDGQTGKQESLRISDRTEAARIVHARNEGERQPMVSMQMARAYLASADPAVTSRTWSCVMEEMGKLKQGPTLERWSYAVRDQAFDPIRDLVILETRAEHLLRVLETGTVSTNVYLRRIHNFAMDMSWLPWPLIPKKRWPAIHHKTRRAIKWEEHQAILAREPNQELRKFYELMWHLGGSQSDVATLKGEDIDWNGRVIGYHRRKTGTIARLHFGDVTAHLLETLPREGFLFPRLAGMHEKHRCKEFHRRVAGLGFKGLSLHSYRYAWAQRAKGCGFPERFAQEALGHSSKAVHRAYARGTEVEIPSIEEYEAARARENRSRPLTSPKPPQTGEPSNQVLGSS